MDSSKVFSQKHAAEILKNRFVVVIGDSIQRTIYKDLVLLLQNDRYLNYGELKMKGDHSFLGDELIEGGRKDKMTNGISYKEVRHYQTEEHLLRFYFMTRCYNSYLETILKDLKEEPTPDVLIMNSCLWDITRYGKGSINDYKENLEKLFSRFLQCLPAECLVIWTTTLPISSCARGGFLVPEIEFMSTTLRLDILEANYFAKKLAADHGFDVLDLHFYLRHYLQCRVKDGIHWDMMAHRYITNLLLSHVCDAWNIPMPAKRPATFGSYGSRAAVPQQRFGSENLLREKNENNNFFEGRYPQGNFSSHGDWSSNSDFASRSGWNSSYDNRQGNWDRGYSVTNTTTDLSNWVFGDNGNGFENRRNGPALSERNRSYWPMQNGPCPRNGPVDNDVNFGIMTFCMQQLNQQYQWQSYEDNTYRAIAPNRHQMRHSGNNPYARQRRY